jgi:predicted  nucleic acid-binding Zn-ribbon protein
MPDEELLKRLETISGQIRNLDQRAAEGFAEVRGEIAEVRGEVAEVRGEIAEVRGEVAKVRQEMAMGFETQQEFTRDMETRLLSEFRRWAQGSESRGKANTILVNSFDERLRAIENSRPDDLLRIVEVEKKTADLERQLRLLRTPPHE